MPTRTADNCYKELSSDARCWTILLPRIFPPQMHQYSLFIVKNACMIDYSTTTRWIQTPRGIQRLYLVRDHRYVVQ